MKPTAIVRLEGTLATGGDAALLDPGKPVETAAEKLAALKLNYRVVIVSPVFNTFRGLRLGIRWLADHGIDAYDELWAGPGIPDGVWYDNLAEKL